MRYSFLVLSSIILSACSTRDRSEPVADTSQATPAPLPAHTTATALPAPAAPRAQGHAEAPGVDPNKVLGWLKNGNVRFTRHHQRKDGNSAKDRTRLAEGQRPHAIVLSCSDSRVPPELVFDQKLGELFVVRTAGQALDAMALASIEYATVHLGSRLIVVLGHESCGAVKAALQTPEGKSAGSASLDALVANLRPHVSGYMRGPASTGFIAEVTANAHGAAAELLQRSTIVSEAVRTGKVKVVTGVYHLASGQVIFD